MFIVLLVVLLVIIGIVYNLLSKSKQIAIRSAFRKTWSWVLRWIIFPTLWISLILVTVVIVCLVLSHICNIFDGVNCPSFVKSATNQILSKIGVDDIEKLSEQNYTAIVADLIVILAFIITIAPFIQVAYFKIQYARKYRKEQGIETVEVKVKGDDDLLTMLRYYKEAEHITIFCGAFDWLCDTESGMRAFIESFANDDDKLTLISYKSEEVVRAAFEAKEGGDILLELLMRQNCFRFESGLNNVKCSLIEGVGTEKRFLFRQSSDRNAFNACVLSSTDQSKELLQILSRLIEKGNWSQG